MISRALNLTLVRYIVVSIIMYLFILGGMFLLVTVLRVDKVASYIIIYLSAYLIEYIITLFFVFRTGHHWIKVLKFIVHTAVFLVFGTLLFRWMLQWGMNYLVVTLATALLLLPFRYLSNNYLVYR